MIRRVAARILGLWRPAPVAPRDPGPDFTSERARQYHQSNQLGRN